jgi:hypothetical protein
MVKDLSIKSIPGAFYDLIVYYASGILLITVIVISSVELNVFTKALSTIGALDKLLLAFIALSVGYVYGQMSSALSSFFIKKPVSRIAKSLKLRSYKDYKFDYFREDKSFSLLQECEKELKGNYWTLIYYIKLNAPEISDDLMKRYARVKLARANAFNFFILSVVSLITSISDNVASKLGLFDVHLSAQWWTVLCFVLTLLFCVEFYQRQAWFGDIFIKIYSAFNEWHRKV